MKVTSVKVHKVNKENSHVRGFATVVFDDCFAVHSIRIIEGQEGLFIAMPNSKNSLGEYKDIAHPINSEMRATLNDAVIDAYNNAEEK